ncbi:hypothetical protein BC628DRAFT_67211 [Trametes gibbosa]|nr:hypothetical protein BC628DRAFT_67211 [Trametes gibbosa]
MTSRSTDYAEVVVESRRAVGQGKTEGEGSSTVPGPSSADAITSNHGVWISLRACPISSRTEINPGRGTERKATWRVAGELVRGRGGARCLPACRELGRVVCGERARGWWSRGLESRMGVPGARRDICTPRWQLGRTRGEEGKLRAGWMSCEGSLRGVGRCRAWKV